MSKLITKARAGVTLVELLVVILIVTILSVGLLPLLKPYIEQAKYAAEVQPTLGNVQTKINLYQYERDRLPCTATKVVSNKTEEDNSEYDNVESIWVLDKNNSSEKLRAYMAASSKGSVDGDGNPQGYTEDPDVHLSKTIDVDWQDLMGKRMNPSQFRYHLIKGLGAAKYGYAIGVFGDGDGLAKGTGYAILVLVDTKNKAKVIATWERYKPKDDAVVNFKAMNAGDPGNDCAIPTASYFESTVTSKSAWATLLGTLKSNGWSFNFDDYEETSGTGGGSGSGS